MNAKSLRYLIEQVKQRYSPEERQRRLHERMQENQRTYEEFQEWKRNERESRRVARAAELAKWKYYPVTSYKGSSVHLMHSKSPRIPIFTTMTYALCGKRVVSSLPGTARDATCSVCRLKAGVGRSRGTS